VAIIDIQEKPAIKIVDSIAFTEDNFKMLIEQ
jgi:hypothetical protein